MTKFLLRVGMAALVLIGAAACSPDQLKDWYQANGIDYSHLTDAEIAAQANAITNYFAEQAELSKFDWVLNEDQLARLRACESGGNYRAVSSTGLYRGAYQFSQSTWNYVAGMHFPKYVGVDPAAAEPKVQDSMTRALWYMEGRAPWPVCGRGI